MVWRREGSDAGDVGRCSMTDDRGSSQVESREGVRGGDEGRG